MQIAWDILFHTSIVYLTGGINSQYKFLYWISILFSSILFLRIGAIVAAALSALFYGMLVDLEYYESLPQFVESFTHFKFSSEKVIVNSIMVNTLVFSFIGFVSSVITIRLSNAEASVLEQNKRLKDLEEKVMRSKHLASVGEMAARIAHEIRNPLTSVSASMEMLSKKEDQGSNEGMILDIARREARRLNQLLTDFLDYARPSSPNFLKEKLSKQLSESIQLFQQGHPDIDIKIQNEIPPAQEKLIRLDLRMVSQVLWNVLKNAAESMNGKGKVKVVLKEESNVRYVIEVQDEGEGFELNQQEKLFEPFYSTKPKGTGLGLSIAYRVMQDHQGAIQLEGIPKKGSICRLVFPVEEKTNA
jgi:two-component system sensor histidine kinase HydH